jgi:hypothetical protein
MAIEALTIMVSRREAQSAGEAIELAKPRAERAGFAGEPDAFEETDHPEPGWAIRWEQEWD